MTRMGWLGVVVWTACGEPARPPAPPAPPVQAVPAERPIRLPVGAWAVADLELRTSPLGSLARRIAGYASSLPARCPAAFASARRATITLEDIDTDYTHNGRFMALYDVDAAALRACLDGHPAPLAEPPGACARLDRALDDLTACTQIPASLAPALDGAMRALAGDHDAAACETARGVIERVRARRDELAWCQGKPRPPAVALGDDAFDLGDHEVLQIVDGGHLVATFRSTGYADPAREVRDILADDGPPRWYDAARFAPTPGRAAWFAIEDRTNAAQRARPAQRAVGEVFARDDVELRVRLVDTSVNARLRGWLAASERVRALAIGAPRVTRSTQGRDDILDVRLPLAAVAAMQIAEVFAPARADCRSAGATDTVRITAMGDAPGGLRARVLRAHRVLERRARRARQRRRALVGRALRQLRRLPRAVRVPGDAARARELRQAGAAPHARRR